MRKAQISCEERAKIGQSYVSGIGAQSLTTPSTQVEATMRVADEYNKLGVMYQAECRRSNEWRVRFEEMSDKRDGALEELRKALNRIKLLETEIEKLVNEA